MIAAAYSDGGVLVRLDGGGVRVNEGTGARGAVRLLVRLPTLSVYVSTVSLTRCSSHK